MIDNLQRQMYPEVRIIPYGDQAITVQTALAACFPSVYKSIKIEELESDATRDSSEFPLIIAVCSSGGPSWLNDVAERVQTNGLRLIPIEIDSSCLRIGPIILPGESPCWACWRRREQQHSAFQPEILQMRRFYDLHPDARPRGFLQSFGEVAARQISAMVSSDPTMRLFAGKIWQLDLFRLETLTAWLIGVDGCVSCGLKRDHQAKSFVELKQALSSSLS